MTIHIDRANRVLVDAYTDAELIDGLPQEEANTYEARRARHRLGFALKAAEVHALLAIAQELRELESAVRS